jgi:sugar O-acyltransferase (sialic acid O-acetyltransferase NeuD family)
MKSIYILGSSGFAKEVFFLLNDLKIFDVKGFIDKERNDSIQFEEGQIPVISEEDFMLMDFDELPELAMGIGDPQLIQKLSIKFKKYKFPNIIHSSAILDIKNINLGIGNIITAGVILTTHIDIGDFNIFNLNCTIGHDVKISNYNVINPSVNISGNVNIGNGNLLGVGSIILQGKVIGNNSIIGASSLVTKDVENEVVVIGIPAKKIK